MERILKGLNTFPTSKGWLEIVFYAFVFSIFVLLVSPNLINLTNTPEISELFLIALIAFVVPAFLEELFFRGFLIKEFNFFWIFISLSLFIIWHPLQAVIFLPQAKSVFLSNEFLILVALLGGFCTLAYKRTKSLWSCIILHWLIVVSWRALGGARFVY